MSVLDIVILAVILLALAAAGFSVAKGRKSPCHGCSGNCESCGKR